jgi:hypothetical protein
VNAVHNDRMRALAASTYLSMIRQIGRRRLWASPSRRSVEVNNGRRRAGWRALFSTSWGLTPRPGGAASGEGFEIFLGFQLLEVLRPARRLRVELGFAGSVVGAVLD